MTKRNSNSMLKPFLLKPAGKDYLWGGTRLAAEFGKDFDFKPLAETWECSTHPDGPSIIASGVHEGHTLRNILIENPHYLGTHPNSALLNKGELPVLIKFIDAKKDLSVQVHPDDNYAMLKEDGQMGKTEMWYVMDATKDAKLVYGFEHDMTKEKLRDSLEDGSVEKYLQSVKVKKDDVFFIEAGTVHAIGAGALIAEIQQNSNLTYRLYDYNRRDKDGNLRTLHKDKAIEVANLNSSSKPKQPMRVLKYQKGAAWELLCRCKYFQVKRYLLNTEQSRDMVAFNTEDNSFQVFLCMQGCGVIYMEDGELLNFFKGDCIFVPANSIGLKFHGKAQILNVSC